VFVCILSEKAVPEMTYTVSGGTLNPTHSLTHSSLPLLLSYRVLDVALGGPIVVFIITTLLNYTNYVTHKCHHWHLPYSHPFDERESVVLWCELDEHSLL